MTTITDITKDQAITAGGNLWERDDKSRVYLDVELWGPMIGADLYWDRKRRASGIRSINGKAVSNAEEARILCHDIYVDADGLQVIYNGGNPPRVISTDDIAATIAESLRNA